MILPRTPDDGTLGHWHMGTAELLLNAGHAEYTIDAAAKPIALESFSDEDYEDSLGVFPWLPEAFRPYAAAIDLDGWETVYHLTGPVIAIAHAFYQLALMLDPSMDPANYTPGGDDDTFDYWPSGMRLLYQLAVDLDELIPPHADVPGYRATNPTGERYLTRYRQVLAEAVARDVPEMEGVVPLAD